MDKLDVLKYILFLQFLHAKHMLHFWGVFLARVTFGILIGFDY